MATNMKWTWEETLKAFALYFILPSGKHDKRNPDIIALASDLGRTPSAVVLKLANIKAKDPFNPGAGMANGSKLDARVWEVYAERGDGLLADAMELLADCAIVTDHQAAVIDTVFHDLPEGRERTVVTTERANQSYFRNSLLDIYGGRCCVTGMNVEPLLVASHIKPWKDADPKTERLAPDNGLLLDALHDKAFDRGFMTIDLSLRVRVSKQVPRGEPWSDLLWRYDRQEIALPRRSAPRRDFIEYHNDVVFRG